MDFIDTHCHLDAAEFGGAQNEIVLNAASAGVRTIVVPTVASGNFDSVRQLCERHHGCVPAYGIHPLYVDQSRPDDLIRLRDCLSNQQAVAVGEIGLDFFIEGYNQTRQEYWFVEQLKLAREFDLPVLLHVRRSQDTVLKHLRQFYARSGPTSSGSGQASTTLRTGIVHAFNGSRQQADEFIKLGFKLGFGGAMTYPRALRIRGLAATLPLDGIVLETDAPDIPPDFLQRGLPNEPQYLPRIAQTLATLRDMTLEDIAAASTCNALSVLPLVEKYSQHV